MATEKKKYDSARFHTQYFVGDVPVPGVTTVLRNWNPGSNFLVKWANKLGMEGYDSQRQMEQAGRIGTLTHLMFEKGIPDTTTDDEIFSSFCGDYTKDEFLEAFVMYQKLRNWRREFPRWQTVKHEIQLVSQQHMFGGTLDALAQVAQNVFDLGDLKTSNSTQSNHITQLAAYAILAEENGYELDKFVLLNARKNKSLSVQWFDREEIEQRKELFLDLLSVYRRAKKLGDI